jgi:hypothetical protein
MCRLEQLESQKGLVITYKIRVGFAGSGGSNMSGYINAKENDALNMPNIPRGMPRGRSLGVSSRLGRISRKGHENKTGAKWKMQCPAL